MLCRKEKLDECLNIQNLARIKGLAGSQVRIYRTVCDRKHDDARRNGRDSLVDLERDDGRLLESHLATRDRPDLDT